MQLFMYKDGLPRDVKGKIPEFAQKRHDFTKRFCEKQGWSVSNLSIEQIIEVRKQPEWIKAGAIITEEKCKTGRYDIVNFGKEGYIFTMDTQDKPGVTTSYVPMKARITNWLFKRLGVEKIK